MFSLLKPSSVIFVAAFAGILVISLFTGIGNRIAALIVVALFAIFTFGPVWRRIWRTRIIGPYLSNLIFPDLNGKWTVHLKSNWPVLKAVQEAASNSEFDRVNNQTDQNVPELTEITLRCKIKQNWISVKVEFQPNEEGPLIQSRTISTKLLPADEENPKRLVWVYRQENADIESTDEQMFLGAAMVHITDDNDVIQGSFWTNRAWQKGLNTAGRIRLEKIK